MAPFNLTMKIGDTRRVKINATWPEDVPEFGGVKGAAYPLNSAAKVWFTAKLSADQDDAQAPIRKDTSLSGNDDITFVGSTAYFNIVSADTDDWTASRSEIRLICEVQVKNAGAGGEVWTVADGVLVLEPQIQHAST